MMAKLSYQVAENLIQANIINKTDKEVYEYGISIIFTYAINLVTILAIGVVKGQLWECLLFLLVFIPLRSYAGGYHATSEMRCYFLSVGSIVLALSVLHNIPVWFNFDISLLWLAASCVVICILAPVENKNKPLDSDEKKIYRRRARSVMLTEFAAGLVCYFFSWDTAFRVIVLGMTSVGCSLVAGVAANRLAR